MPRRPSLLAVALLALAACGGSSSGSGGGGSPTMRPGEDCLGCHAEFTAAGTVYGADASQGLAGVTVRIDGTRQQNVTMTTNGAGNFYTTVDFGYGPGATVTVQGASGQSPYELTNRTFAACNSCHPAGHRIHDP
jgi:hypothetical protein